MNEKIFIAIIITAIVVGGALYFYFFTAQNFDKATVQGNPGFVMSDNLSCAILYSTDKQVAGKSISLIGLETDSPKMLPEDGGAYPMNKIFETNKLLVIQNVASGSGSVDTFHIDKEKGIFTRAASGVFLSEYVVATKGNCK